MAEEDKKLPLAGHVVSALQHFHFIKNFIFIMFMWPEKVIVSNPERQIIVGTVDVIKAVCVAVRSFIGAVEPFDHLFERAVFRRNSIVVGKSNDLGDLEGKIFPELLCEFHCGERIGTVAVSDELKVLWQFCKSLESHTHGKDAGADATVVRYLITDDRAGGGVHDEPDIGLDTAYFYVGFISCKGIPFFVRILVNEWLDADGGGLAVVGDLLVGDADVIQIFERLGGFSQGKPKIDMKGETQGHDMGVVLTEF